MVGEALIRPSSKSSDSLAIHWLYADGKTKVVEVLEEDKETEASIGNKLKIKVSCSMLVAVFNFLLGYLFRTSIIG